uniref:BED-type domain-containing protein n=1 Tax=Fagus sylvatica TaxID=28930 RepID=A0A2N9GFF2_FAGSY
MHMVGWGKICKPKGEEGLGIYATKPRNKALLAKLNWRLLDENDSLWARTIRAKYWPNGPISDCSLRQRNGSNNWRGLKVGHEGPLTPGKDLLKICDVIEGVSLWGLSKISFPLPSPLLAQIKAINLCTLSSRKDCVAWGSLDDAFNLRKAYLVASFSRSIGIASCVQTELRALLDGLLLAIELDIPKLEIELNSLIVAELFTSTKIAKIFLSSIVYDCRSLLDSLQADQASTLSGLSTSLTPLPCSHSVSPSPCSHSLAVTASTLLVSLTPSPASTFSASLTPSPASTFSASLTLSPVSLLNATHSSQQPPTTHRVTIACSAESVESTNMALVNLVDKVNLVDEDEDDDDLVELEDVPITVGTQKRKAKRRKTSAVWAFFEMLPTKGDDDKPYYKCKKCINEYLSPVSYGTGTLKRHIESCYKKRTKDIAQLILGNKNGSMSVREKLFALFGEYVSNVPTPSSTTSNKRGKAVQDLQFKSFSKETMFVMKEFDCFESDDVVGQTQKTQLELYLEEPRMDRNAKLDILSFWKGNQFRYPELAAMVRDVLSIPISTVASESTFSVGGRVIDQFRSALKPDVVEALICSRDWLYGDKELAESQLDDLTEDIMKMDINKENNDEPPSMGSNPTQLILRKEKPQNETMALRGAVATAWNVGGRHRNPSLQSIPRFLKLKFHHPPSHPLHRFTSFPIYQPGGLKYPICAISEATADPLTPKKEDEEQSPQNWTIKMLYDGDCPLCMREVDMLRERNKRYGTIKFVNISSNDYSPEENQGLDYKTVMGRIHAILSDGTVVTDVEIATITDAVYGVWAKYRLQITGRPPLEAILESRKKNKDEVCNDKNACKM